MENEIKVLKEVREEIKNHYGPVSLNGYDNGRNRGLVYAVAVIDKKIATLEAYQSDKGNAKFSGDMQMIDFYDPK